MKRGTKLILCGAFLIAASCLWAAWNSFQNDSADERAQNLLVSYQAKQQAVSESVTDTEGVSAAQGQMPALTIDGYPISGTLSISAIDITLAVMSNWSYPQLQISACTYSGTAADGELILLAHNYDQHFGRLKNLSVGDAVDFTDVNGIVYHYQVAEVDMLGKYELDKLTSGGWDLTLFTCTYGGQSRVVVRCNRI